MKRMGCFALLALMSGSLQCTEWAENMSPYVGVDAQVWHTAFVKNFGNNEFKQNYYPQANLFFGLKFNKCFGLEFGYFNGPSRKVTSIASRDFYLGRSLLPNEINVADTKAQFQGFNLSPVVFYHLNEKNKLIAAVGVTYLQVKLNYQLTSTETRALTLAERESNRRDFSKNKFIAHAKVGFEHALNDYLGLRVILGWENTKKFKQIESKQQTPVKLKASLKDTTTLNIGLSWYF